MATPSKFQGKFMYYENINGKEKKISKSFTDAKKFNDFSKKYPMPTLGSMLGFSSSKALPSKWMSYSDDMCCGSSCGCHDDMPTKKLTKKPTKKRK